MAWYYSASDPVVLLQGVRDVPAGVRKFRRRHLVCRAPDTHRGGKYKQVIFKTRCWIVGI